MYQYVKSDAIPITHNVKPYITKHILLSVAKETTQYAASAVT